MNTGKNGAIEEKDSITQRNVTAIERTLEGLIAEYSAALESKIAYFSDFRSEKAHALKAERESELSLKEASVLSKAKLDEVVRKDIYSVPKDPQFPYLPIISTDYGYIYSSYENRVDGYEKDRDAWVESLDRIRVAEYWVQLCGENIKALEAQKNAATIQNIATLEGEQVQVQCTNISNKIDNIARQIIDLSSEYRESHDCVHTRHKSEECELLNTPKGTVSADARGSHASSALGMPKESTDSLSAVAGAGRHSIGEDVVIAVTDDAVAIMSALGSDAAHGSVDGDLL